MTTRSHRRCSLKSVWIGRGPRLGEPPQEYRKPHDHEAPLNDRRSGGDRRSDARRGGPGKRRHDVLPRLPQPADRRQHVRRPGRRRRHPTRPVHDQGRGRRQSLRTRELGEPAVQDLRNAVGDHAFPTLGVANGPVGADAIARFASVVKADGTCPSLPETTDKNFEIDTGNGFGYLGAPYSATHSYTYLVIPTKNRIAVRFYDPAAKDNYGQFKVTVSAAGIL